MQPYAELHARSVFSFLRGASQPEQMVYQSASLGLPTLALCERDGVFSAPRAYAIAQEINKQAREEGLKVESEVATRVGAEVTMEDGSVLPLLMATQAGYQNLCRMLTRSRLRAPKGEGSVTWKELAEFNRDGGWIALTGDEEGPLRHAWDERGKAGVTEALARLRRIFSPGHLYLELQRHQVRSEGPWNRLLLDAAKATNLPLVATNGAVYHAKPHRTILDVMTCLRHHTHLDAAGLLLAPNAERHLKGAAEMNRLFVDLPEAIVNTMRIAEQLQFSLKNLGYEFPRYPVPGGGSMAEFLTDRTWAGARDRYPDGIPARIRGQIETELALIIKLHFEGYFLIVWDLIEYCRRSNIMVQGRGSAANSVVCFCLRITAVDPMKHNVLFERFLTENRKGWPDIDLDLPSGERREQVIQEVYRHYGRHGAAMTANVITYRGRSTIREIAKVLHLPEEVATRYSALYANGDFPHTLTLPDQLRQAGLEKEHPRLPALLYLAKAMYGFPRHLGQHSGGMIVCQGQLDAVVPLENASMPGRSVVQWDKDDCEDMGMVKIDLLGLGMMAVLQDTIELCSRRGRPVDIAQLDGKDEATFDAMCAADTIGVFQIESRAQQATLPRLKPRCFYDVVVEVAIIRPGPIQGKMVHPYLERRENKDLVRYPDERLKPVLDRTLGVPLFQEQMLQMAMIMAGFSGEEAEELRKAISFHRSDEKIVKVEAKLRAALEARGVNTETKEELVASIRSFALYGFPESHAISFALLAYSSTYLKVHRPAEFLCGLLNNQPMGFYSPATLIQDSRRHGVRIQPVSLEVSGWGSEVIDDLTVRLGFHVINGVRQPHVEAMLAARAERPFTSVSDWAGRTPFSADERRAIAGAGALNGLATHRRQALWCAEEPASPDDLFYAVPRAETSPLPAMTLPERVRADYRSMSLTTGAHPLALARPHLPELWRAIDLAEGRNGQQVIIGGAVICRQRPGTAKGNVFISLEDETGVANAVVFSAIFEHHRMVVTQEPFLRIEGKLQLYKGTCTVLASAITALDVEALPTGPSYDFH